MTMEKTMNEPLVFTGHEGFAAAVMKALEPFRLVGVAVRMRPWNKGLYQVTVGLPTEPPQGLREEIGAIAYRTGAAFYAQHGR